MGQYYKAIALNDYGNPINGWVYSHDYDSGLKLMEHSWMLNPFVNAVEGLLSEEGKWYKKKIVWGGDYADEEPGLTIVQEGKKINPNLYSLCNDKKKVKPKQIEPLTYQYLINHTKNEYVDKLQVPDFDGWRIHPLPLLTCEGNGRGGGDYRGESDLIGYWSRDKISVGNQIPDGFKELIFDLVEN